MLCDTFQSVDPAHAISVRQTEEDERPLVKQNYRDFGSGAAVQPWRERSFQVTAPADLGGVTGHAPQGVA
jgi:hypothetical protein